MSKIIKIDGTTAGNKPTHRIVEIMHPEIYEQEKTTVEIGMCHTRAADSIRVSYDSDRDGWIIEQASKFSWDADDDVCDRDWKEVAFVQAWAREEQM